jgi:serine/threonine-protein kinase RsbW
VIAKAGIVDSMMGHPWVYDSTTGWTTLNDVEDILDRMWAVNFHVPGAVRMEVGIAAAEIAANIVEHSGAKSPVWMRMEARVGLSEVRVNFTDDGPPSPVELERVSLPHEMAETGRGLALAQAVLQTLSYRRNGLNHWTLVSKPF